MNFLAECIEQFRVDGGLQIRTSSTGSTMPTPKKWDQTMLARFLAKYGLSVEASHCGEDHAADPCHSRRVRPAQELGGHDAFPTRCRISPRRC